MADNALRSPFGLGPQSLDSPVPGEEDIISTIDQISQVRIPQEKEGALIPESEAPPVQAPSTTEEQPGFDFFAGVDAPAAEEEAPLELPDQGIGEEPLRFSEKVLEMGPLDAVLDEFKTSVGRAKASFGQTNREKISALEPIFGEGNVKVDKAGDITIIKGDREVKFDADHIELLDDTLDWTREIVEGLVDIGGRAAAGLGAASVAAPAGAGVGLAGGPLAPATVPAGALTAGGAAFGAGAIAAGPISAVGALEVGDFIAEEILGITRDPQRSKGEERSTAAAFGLVAPGIGAFLARRRALKAIEKRLTKPDDVIEHIEDMMGVEEGLRKAGIDIRLSPAQQAKGFDTGGEEIEKALTKDERVRKFFRQQGEMANRAFEKLQNSISNLTGKSKKDLFHTVKKKAKVNTQLEAELMDSWRDQAVKAARKRGKLMVPMPRSSQFKEVFDVWGSMTKEEFFERFPDAAPAGDAIYNRVNRYAKKMSKQLASGEVNISRLRDEFYGRKLPNKPNIGITGIINDLMGTKTGHDVATSLIDIKDAMRSDWDDAIEVLLDGNEGYLRSRESLSKMIKAQDNLRGILKKENLTSSSFARKIFSGDQSRDEVAGIKELIAHRSPEVWESLKGQWVSDLIEENAIEVGKFKRVNWDKVNDAFKKLDKNGILDQMYDKKTGLGKNEMMNFLKLAKNIDQDFNFAKPDAKSFAKIRNLLLLALPDTFWTTKASGAARLIAEIGEDKALVKWLDGEGLELILQGASKQQRTKLQKAWASISTGLPGAAGRQTVRTGAAGARMELQRRTQGE